MVHILYIRPYIDLSCPIPNISAYIANNQVYYIISSMNTASYKIYSNIPKVI